MGLSLAAVYSTSWSRGTFCFFFYVSRCGLISKVPSKFARVWFRPQCVWHLSGVWLLPLGKHREDFFASSSNQRRKQKFLTMASIAYSDLDMQDHDVFNKGDHFGQWKEQKSLSGRSSRKTKVRLDNSRLPIRTQRTGQRWGQRRSGRPRSGAGKRSRCVRIHLTRRSRKLPPTTL